ncbi:MAG TPA: TIGR01777 family oxidoreductase [Thermoleophilaceae bacterium]
MRVAVTGATGNIGSALVRELLARGDEVVALTRDPAGARAKLGEEVSAVRWEKPAAEPAPAAALSGCDAVVHLLGEPVDQRWSEEARRRIRDSRVNGTRYLVAGLRDADPRPPVLVSQSATGWYGPHGDEPVDEGEPAADDFLARVVRDWEGEARAAEELGMRVALMRTGVVLSESGGALGKMITPFKLGVGGPVASGRQYVPWVHMDDVVGAFTCALEDGRVRGPVNVTAPEPATNRDFSKALGRVLRRPAFMPVPGFALKLMYGEMSSIVTTGARVVPGRLAEIGYRFRRPGLEDALRAATGRG